MVERVRAKVLKNHTRPTTHHTFLREYAPIPGCPLSLPPPPPPDRQCLQCHNRWLCSVENLSLWQSSAVLCNVLFSQEIK